MKTETKMSAGPWLLGAVDRNDNRQVLFSENDGRVLADVCPDRSTDWGTAQARRDANARLIAVAPEMRDTLEATDIALTNMLQVFSDRSLGDSARAKVQIMRDRIRALLARIDGD